ncbi:sensor histidine kinase [Stutzerimonas stutzeri B1SMN1]|nr:sensor histidine kinase [Stutzerimonas stutzeri B1SMN1]
MSALWRINLLVTLLFTLITMVCLAVLLRQAAHDVKRELDAAAAVVGYLGEMAERDPDSLRPGLTDSLRHIGVLGILPPNIAKTAGGPAIRGLQGAISF